MRQGHDMFSKVLIANRGEIAVRVIRTLRDLGIASVAVYSDADAGARHVLEADEAVRIGPAAALDSYLNAGALIAAARGTGAEAVHPGYGFLAENAGFARACAEAGLVFIGPPAAAIDAMGDKIASKATVKAAGVPVVPGAGAPGLSDEDLISQLNELWFPVLIKPSAGGGGKGMRVVSAPTELPGALTAARRTAVAAFGDGTLLVERYLPRPRHIEIQVLADAHGHVVHLGERECSLQRRHQKIIEEAPSPLLTPAQRAAMGAAAVAAARSVGYVGAGTVEFIVAGDAPDDFFFMEMNTRLQVEHPVTELVYGLDLVEWQLRVAAGEPLPFGDGDGAFDNAGEGVGGAGLPMRGHAVEARVYAEDPARGFLPTGGTVLALREPAGPGIRVDSALAEGVTVTSDYDPMLAKVVAWGEDRATALRRLDAALAGTVVLGVTTNVAFLRGLLADPDVRAGRLDTGLVERSTAAGDPAAGATAHALAAAALARLLAREPRGPVTDPWDIPDGWRPGDRAWTRLRLSHGPGTAGEVRVRGLASAGAEVAVGDGEPEAARAEFRAAPGGGTDLVITAAGQTRRYAYAADGATAWLGRDGRTWAVREERAASPRAGRTAAADGTVRSPMPGTVLAVHVTAGQRVTAGQPVLVVEAMKMEHTVTAPADGVVAELTAKAGQQVAMDEQLAVIGPEQADSGRLGTRGCTQTSTVFRADRSSGAMLSYKLDEEHEELRKSVEEFARDEVAPVIGDLYERGEFPYDIVAKMGRMGLFGLPVPEEYGGMGGDYFALCLALEELARVDSSVAITVEAGVGLGVMPLFRFGSDEQKRQWLPALCAGEKLSAFGLTEPGGGTDVAGAMKTRAVLEKGQGLEDGHWVINGSKSFITNSGTSITALVGVAAVTGTRADGKPEISTILVPSGTPGFTVAPKYSKVGWSCSDTHELSFDNCRVPESNLLGERGRGYAQFLRTLDEGRVAIAALSTGLAQGCVDESLAYVRDRTAFGGPIGRFQSLQFKIADMEVRAHNARLAWWHAAAKMAAGEPFKKEAAIAKLTASDAAMDNARDATQIFGGYGFMNEYAVGRFYRDAKILEVGEGTSEVQRMLIARELGLTY